MRPGDPQGNSAYIVAIRGRTAWLKNVEANPDVHLRVRGGAFGGVVREAGESAEVRQARTAYCETVNPLDYLECAIWPPGRPSRSKIRSCTAFASTRGPRSSSSWGTNRPGGRLPLAMATPAAPR